MRELNKRIKEVQNKTENVQLFLAARSFETYQDDYLAQGAILQNLKQAKDLCYDLGRDIIQQQGWGEPKTLEDIFYILQEKGVIDSDLVDQMIAIYRLRELKVIEKIDENDLDLVDQILRQDLADIDLYLHEIKEFFNELARKKKKQPAVEGNEDDE